jgi:DNA polymerase alpha subunit B
LFYKHEAFVLSRPSGLRVKLSVMSLDTARELKKEIQREYQAKAVAASAHQSDTPKSNGVGMRKSKGNMADLGGLYVSHSHRHLLWKTVSDVYSLDGLSTPIRKSSGGVPSRLASGNNSASSLINASPFGPQSTSYATPSKDLTPQASASSYRPGPSKLHTPVTSDYLSTPIGKTNGSGSGASSPVSGPESPTS